MRLVSMPAVWAASSSSLMARMPRPMNDFDSLYSARVMRPSTTAQM